MSGNSRHALRVHSGKRLVSSNGRGTCSILLLCSTASGGKALRPLLAGRRPHRRVPGRLPHRLFALDRRKSVSRNALFPLQELLASFDENLHSKFSGALHAVGRVRSFSESVLRSAWSLSFPAQLCQQANGGVV